MKKIIAILFIFLFSFILTACEVEQLDQKFNITFEVNGEIYETREVFFLERVSLPDNPELEDMEFEYWMHNGEAFDINTRITIDLILVASFKDANDVIDPIDPVDPIDPITPDVTKYSVFVYDNDKLLKEIVVESGKTVDLTSIVTSKDGLSFKGWFLDNSFQNKFDQTSKITKDTHLFGKWDEIIPGDYMAYYQNISLDMDLTTFRKTLNSVIREHKVLGYNSTTNDYLKQTDKDLATGKTYLLYTGPSTSSFNKEHVWPQSRGEFGRSAGIGSDLHNLKPTLNWINSDRGNLYFDEGGEYWKNTQNKRVTNTSFEPQNQDKGDIARMLFYMDVRYEANDRMDLVLVENPVKAPKDNGNKPEMGKLSILLKWHLEDPVDDFERARNNKIHEIQGNRNPFIDYPEWVEKVWPEINNYKKVNISSELFTVFNLSIFNMYQAI